ncbi:PAS domain-containing sensor histidine kinase [Georgenia sp. TF02-10]|uniref:sensor histidine kinase n=1 Tax=Georgenia sp. TF02-10 TaxID=2917725 RepID=UPI001FA7B7AE|nr:PAS domain-containing sensor histidine kinase [Georgenia sp. TF02-10]UNX56422.1 PAS domain-containing sensor histidine kinase [Georgenia sp. TF02-10]
MIAAAADVEPADAEWLHQLVGDWQVVADLAFADLVLWLPTDDGSFVVAAHCRPSTAGTVHYDDIVGDTPTEPRRQLMNQTLLDRGIHLRAEHDGERGLREVVIPVVHDGRAVAVLTRESALPTSRVPSRLEISYMEIADVLCAMMSRGEFPQPAPTGSRRGAPRVGDGLVRLDAEGRVLYASPNAVSNFHRLGVIGELKGAVLAELVTALLEEHTNVDEALAVVVMGRAPWRTDIEARGVALSLRAVPLLDRGERSGALLLCRDVTEVRRRERELLTKDATIREIHHRVKNNLQTVSALLRLQARRSPNEETRAALGEATRRVATIALVHETLSQNLDEVVNFDEVFGRALRLAADVASPDSSVRTVVEGTFGAVGAEAATALAVVLTELVTNAVEHGLQSRSGTVTVTAERDGLELTVRVADDGVGLEQGKVLTGLGTQIVSTIVTNELHGSIHWAPRPEGGTEVVLHAHLGQARPKGARG